MYGYDIDRSSEPEPGGCLETLVLTRVAMEVMLPPIGALLILMTLIMAAFFLLTVHPLLSLLVLLPVAAATAWVVRRDRRLQREMEEEIRRGPPK